MTPSNKGIVEYQWFNGIVLVVVIGIFLMIKFVGVPIHCPYAEMGLKCASCGLTASFKSMLNGDFGSNVKSHQLFFMLFALQLPFRPLITLYLKRIKTFTTFRTLRNIDIAFSLILFILTMIMMYSGR